MKPSNSHVWLLLLTVMIRAAALAAPAANGPNPPPAKLVPLSSVRLLDGPFADAVKVNRAYLLAHDPDRLLAPFFREAGLEPKAGPYGNWESSGLDGHTAGHYLSALATMIASGADTPEGELKRRLDYMVVRTGALPEGCQRWLPRRRPWQPRVVEVSRRRSCRGGEPQVGAVV